MCHNQTLTSLQKQYHKKTNKTKFTTFFNARTTIFLRGTTVDTPNLQKGELLHMDFEFYNVTSIQGFNSILTVVCTKIIGIWIFLTESNDLQSELFASSKKNWRIENIHANVWELMIMESWKIKQMSLTFLLMNSVYTWKILVDMSHSSMEWMKYTT